MSNLGSKDPAVSTKKTVVPDVWVGKWAKAIYVDGRESKTKSYQLWRDMRKRCASGGPHQQGRPTYAGCEISEDFQDFQQFATWCQRQIGYGRPGYQLDKDLLVVGNKTYGADECAFVPAALNCFFLSPRGRKVDLPVGVVLGNCGRYRARMNVDGIVRYIGSFDSQESASDAYRAAKNAELARWIGRIESGEFPVDHRVIKALKNYLF